MVEFPNPQIPEAVRSAFISRVKDLPQVQAVYDTKSLEGEGRRLLTVISAPPFDMMYRNPVYQAEMEVLQSIETSADVDFDFRLINIQELQEGVELSHIVPQTDVIYAREEAK
ncbi:MAG: hypothetical protein Q8P92_04010 [Candidatus Daviesbacteria bacterium]|nr:hypothetical protein [Candidatus Daviesbacteria bacterium]